MMVAPGRRIGWFNAVAAIWLISLALDAQTPALRITSPVPDTIVSGTTRLEVTVTRRGVAAIRP